MKKVMLCACTAVALMFGFEAEGMDEPSAEWKARRTLKIITWETEWDHLDDDTVIQKLYGVGYRPLKTFSGVNLDFFACSEGDEPYKLRLMLALYNTRVLKTKIDIPIVQEWSFEINETTNKFKVKEILGRGFVFDKSETFLTFFGPLMWIGELKSEVLTTVTADMTYQEKGNLLLDYFGRERVTVSDL